MSVDKIHRNKVLIRMKYSKRLVAAKLDVITMVIVPLFISHPREWWRNETSCAIERSFIRVEIKFLVSQPYRYIDCVEFLSKVRLRLIRPGSEILSRLFSLFFFFLFEKSSRESFFLFFFFFLTRNSSNVIAIHPPFLGRIRDKLKVNNERAEISDSDCDAISFVIRGLCNSFGSKEF